MIPGPSSSQEFLSFAARSNRLRRTGMNAPHSLRYIFSFYFFLFFFRYFVSHRSLAKFLDQFIICPSLLLLPPSSPVRFTPCRLRQKQSDREFSSFINGNGWDDTGDSLVSLADLLIFAFPFFLKLWSYPNSSSPISLMVKKKKWNENRIKKKKGTNLCISAWSRTIKERNSTPCAWWICTRRGIKKNQIIDKTKKNKKKKTFLVVWIAILLVTTTTCYCDMCCSVVIFREEIITSN